MTEQKKYHSVERYGKSNNEISTRGNIVVWEKIDGSNASFKRVGNEIQTFSRNLELTGLDGLGGFRAWVLQNIDVEKLEQDFLYFGEWSNPHKINYGDNLKKFFLFDVYDLAELKYLGIEFIREEAEHIGLTLAPIFYEGEFVSEEHLQSFVGKSMLAPDGVGEGVVVKNYDYVDKHGNQHFTKIVSKHFQEISGVKVKEMKSKPDVVTQFIDNTVTQARIEKMLYKLVDEGHLKEDFAIEDMGTILKLLGNSVFEDVMNEEADMLHKALASRFGKAVPSKVRETLMNMGRA